MLDTLLNLGIKLRRMRRPQTCIHARSKRKGVAGLVSKNKINLLRRRNCPRVDFSPIYLPGYEASSFPAVSLLGLRCRELSAGRVCRFSPHPLNNTYYGDTRIIAGGHRGKKLKGNCTQKCFSVNTIKHMPRTCINMPPYHLAQNYMNPWK